MKTPTFRCIQIVASIEDSAAGPSYSVSRLSEELERRGIPTSIFTVGGWRQTASSRTDEWCGNRHVAYPQDFSRVPVLNRLCFSRGLSNGLLQHASKNDILHTHGLWLMPNVYPARAARQNGAAVVISPRGMLGTQALRFSPLKKRAFWYLLQRSALNWVKCIHATSDQEYDEIRAFGLRNPVAIIRNGVDLPELTRAAVAANSERKVLSLGRIHPKKGLDRLIRAWAKVEREFPDWRLEFIGPDELGYTQKLKDLAGGLQLSHVSFEPPRYGSAKHGALQDADLFVLPSLNENFGLVIAEALAAGTPVISTRGTPWSELPSRGCGWWVDDGADSLAAALTNAMRMPRLALKEMGYKGRIWMAEAFSWQRVADEMLQVYRWLVAEDKMPATVRLQ